MLLKQIKNVYRRYKPNITTEVGEYFGKEILSEGEGNEFIKKKIAGDDPFFVARIGTTELGITMDYTRMKDKVQQDWRGFGLQRHAALAGADPGAG